MKRAILFGIIWLAGLSFASFMNFFIIETIVIADPCYYHTHEHSYLFSLFYDVPSSEGYHPFPSALNLVLTFFSGIIIGEIVRGKFLKKETTSN